MPAFLRNPKFWIAVVCLLPLARLIALGFSGGLGANPIEFITRSTGIWTLVGLMLTLSITPLRRLSGWAGLIRYRRMLGLFTFFYVCLHFVTYIWLDQFFDPAAIVKDIIKRPFITVGFSAFVLLIPLAATSTRAMIRRLGRRWQQLHRLVYAIAILGVVHYLWLVKKDLTEPLIYGVVLTLLLLMRLPWGGCCCKPYGIDRFRPALGRARSSKTGNRARALAALYKLQAIKNGGLAPVSDWAVPDLL